MNSKVLKLRPMAFALEENGTFSVISFNKNQFEHQMLFKVPFNVRDQKWWQWEREIFSSHDKKIHVIWNHDGFSILKLNN